LLAALEDEILSGKYSSSVIQPKKVMKAIKLKKEGRKEGRISWICI
jgi:hypothetical protein